MSQIIRENKQTFSTLIIGSMLMVGSNMGANVSPSSYAVKDDTHTQSVYIGSTMPSVYSSKSIDQTINEYTGIVNLMNNLIAKGETIDSDFAKCINENFFSLLD